MQILDGTNADVEITLNGTSIKCVSTSLAVEFNRSLMEFVTLCSNGWRQKIPSLKDVKFVIQKLLAKGAAYTKFGQYHLSDANVDFVGQFDEGCSVAVEAQITRDAGSIAAAAMSGGSIEGESVNSNVSVAWVIA